MSRNYELIRNAADAIHTRRGAGMSTRPLPRSIPPAEASNERPNELDLDIHGILRAIVRRRMWIYVCTGSMVALAALACLFMTPQYKAESKLEILKQDTSGLSLNSAGASPDASSDPLDFNVTLQTQLGVLKSDVLAWQVMKELKQVDAKDFSSNPPSDTARPAQQPTEDDYPTPDKRASRALTRFKSSLKVKTIPGTRLISVSYMHPDPQMAARIVNQLVSDFVEYNFQVRYNATAKATEWLGRQLVDLKSQVEKSQERAVQLQKESGIFGQDESHNIVLTRLEQLNNEVTSAEADRVIKENVYKLSRSGNPELVASMLGTQPERSTPDAANPASLLNNLRQQETTLKAEYADASAKYGPAYPRLIQIKDKLGSVRSSIATELGKVAQRAKNEYQLASSREAAARKAFAEQKAVAAQMNDKSIDFLIAKHEADSGRVLYEHLLEKLKEAGVLAGLRSSTLHVLDPAEVPTVPARPNVPLYIGFGAVAGLFLGLVGVVVAETMDRTVRDVEEIESANYVPVLGVIPDAGIIPTMGLKYWLKANKGEPSNSEAQNALLMSLRNGSVAEAFRTVRTSLLLSRLGEPAKVLMITSGMPQEGKSFVSLNLAAAFAYNGGKVLLVDADLRRGTLSRVLKQQTGIGLSEIIRAVPEDGSHHTWSRMLGGDPEFSAAYRQIDDVPGLTFISAGDCPDHASELLGSQEMTALVERWRERFDYVLIDTPPAIPVTDAVVLSRKVDAVIVVVRFAATNRPSVQRTIRILRDVQVARLGVVVNAMDLRSPEYYHYSGFYGRAEQGYRNSS